uniref:hypothetical protein n=1 Tax=Cellulomonas endophytica TaxID=2494735 RepID=UPI00196B6C86
MRHPDDGTLRRLVDEPAGVSDADRTHVAGCATCLAGLAAARSDATTAAGALGSLGTVAAVAPDEVEVGWHALRRASAAPAAAGAGAVPSAVPSAGAAA